MKRAIRLIMCAAMVVTLLAVSAAPVAASTVSESGSFTATGATVNYIARAWYSSPRLYGTINAELRASWYACPNLVIGAGVEEWGCSVPQWSNKLQMDAYGISRPVVTGGVSYNMQTGGADGFAVRLRMVLKGPFNGNARCYTWERGDSSLTPDTAAETTWASYAGSWAIVQILASFMWM